MVALRAGAYIHGMRKLLMTAIISMAASACGDIAVGPVDHSCLVNTTRSYGGAEFGSGCASGGAGSGR